MQSSTSKPEAIYPLQHLQRALLFHHIAAPTNDQGLIQTRCRLIGPLDAEAFGAAWSLTFARHEALRASVHWEKISKPVWVVHSSVVPELRRVDYTHLDDGAQRNAITRFLNDDRREGLMLTKSPACRLTLLQLGPEEHFFLWTSHHLLLDGWSAGIVFRDFFAAYGSLTTGRSPDLPAVPGHKEYFRYLAGRDEPGQERYWRDRLATLTLPTLFAEEDSEQEEISLQLTRETSEGFVAYCRHNHLTQNAVLQGLWAFILGRYFATDTVCFGITVNGRPPELGGMDQLAGMFARILPKVVELAPRDDFFAHIQRQGGREAAHQYVDLDQLADWSRAGGDRLPFNSLLAVQNYPWSKLRAAGLTVTDFEGDTTTRYPVTCMVVPRESWTLHLRYQASIPPALADWMLNTYKELITLAATSNGAFQPSADDVATPPLFFDTEARATPAKRPLFAPPSNFTELLIAGIWEQLLPLENIGIDDNFFASGGTSMAALRLVTRLERESGNSIAPSALLSHPTIRQLARLITSGDANSHWNNLVPQRISGTLPPLFCFHGGLGHVLMYQPLTRHLHPDRPVYALQPNGIDGVSELDGTIEEMAAHYLAEIESLGTADPLILVSYCYSGVICLEIGKLLVAKGRQPPIIIGADIDPPGLFTRQGARRQRKPGSAAWYWGHFRLRQWSTLYEQFQQDYIPSALQGEDLQLRLSAKRLKNGLVDAFAKYRSTTYGHPIMLIRSQDLMGWDSHDYILSTWKSLAGDRLTIRDVPSSHYQIFGEPTVARTAGHIEDYIRARTKEPEMIPQVESEKF